MLIPLLSCPLVIFVAWLLDLLLGDPLWLPHPVVAFGRWITWWERKLNRGNHRQIKGAVFSLLSLFLVMLVTSVFFLLLHRLSLISGCSLWGKVLTFLFSSLIVFFCLAGHTLRTEVSNVFSALDKGIEEGRRQVSRIVGRDTANLTPQEVRTAALETLAENLSDGVVAPLFWLVLLGVPGMLTYKMVNTLDSMIGYRSERYRKFGCWAARIDDFANFIPARITALLMLLASGRKLPQNIRFVLRYGPCHASPNSGWPEAALAACLDCRFGGTHDYFGEKVEKPYIGSNSRNLSTKDLHTSIHICFAAEIFAVLFSMVVVYLIR